MKINKLSLRKAKKLFEQAKKTCPGSKYYFDLLERIKKLSKDK